MRGHIYPAEDHSRVIRFRGALIRIPGTNADKRIEPHLKRKDIPKAETFFIPARFEVEVIDA